MKPFTAAELRKRYGRFYKRRRKLDASLLPAELQPLAPYAEVWGVGDDYEREELVDNAPEVAKKDLLALLAYKNGLNTPLTKWLAENGDALLHTDNYVGLSCLDLAYLSIKSLADWEAAQGELPKPTT